MADKESLRIVIHRRKAVISDYRKVKFRHCLSILNYSKGNFIVLIETIKSENTG